MVLNIAPSSSITHGNNFKLSKQTCSIDVRKSFYSNRIIVDAWNSLPNTVLSASSASNFEMKLREVNLDRFLTIVDDFNLTFVLIFSALYCIFMCILYLL